MVKKISVLFFSLFFLAFFIIGCSPVYCSTPNILYKGECCPDKDEDGICDKGDILVEKSYDLATPQRPEITIPVEKVGEHLLPKTKEGVLLRINQDDDPFLGDPKADTTLILFGDYADRGTQRFHKEVLPQILQTYGDKIKYVFRNYPSLTDSKSQRAAEASECAFEQNKFWEYHDKLFFNIYRLTLSDLYAYADQSDMDATQFKLCLSSRRYREEVLGDVKDGDDYGVILAPTFFCE